ncbi:MAG: hypothetical protein JL56_10435 [Desulfotomaculum sp. BICA1-6]|nr:MAG: hypothetical protein VR67_06600 [Peptococcaceae bacterium BRH_c8a]KJS73521.1 MAG: hypothetical protein JL56_10435 [Desulfotomaculum sp. BICA1-6]
MLISPSVKVLGNQLFNVYLVGKENKIIVECAVSGIIPKLKKQAAEMGGIGNIERLVIMHAHFDHVCGLPGLRGLFPTARVAASAKAADILARETVVENFFREDKAMTVTLKESGHDGDVPAESIAHPRTLPIDEIIQDKQVLHLANDFNLYFHHAPGHSPCSLMAYSPEDEILFSSDSAGFPVDEQMVFPIFFHSYELYIQTIRRMLELSINVLAAAHGDVITGPSNVRSYLKLALYWAERVRHMVLEAVKRGDDREEVAVRIFDLFYHSRLKIYTPENIMMCSRLIVKRAMDK